MTRLKCMTRLQKGRPDLSLGGESRPFCDSRFAVPDPNVYIRRMPSKPIELPPEVAKAFVRDMKAFFAAGGTGPRADGIAAMQLHALKEHYKGKLRLTNVKEMFLQMRD